MCAYYYLGEGHVQSAEELVFELLGQLCDLKYDSSAQDLGDTKRYHITNVVRPPKVDEVATPPIAGPILDSISSINSNDSSHHPGNTRAIIESFPTEGVASGEHDSNLTELTAESIPNRGEITDDQIKFRGQTGEPLSTLLHALSDICSTISPPVFIVLDALDDANMERPCDFLSVIRTLLSSNCRVFLTGRERPDIKPVLLAWPHTQLEIRHPRTVNDIQEYVKHLLDTPQDSHRHIRGYSYSIPDLTEIIANLSDAVFPFAYAYATGSNSALTRLLGRQVQGGKTSGFRTSPLPLREAIAQTLSAIDVLDPNEFPQSLILLLLLNSPVPISISALGEALPIILKLFSASHELNASYYDFPAVSKPIWPLITVDPGNELIHLSSQVVIENLRSVWLREWTKKCPELLPQNFTKQLAIFCLQYQLDCNLEAVDFEAESNVGKLLHQNPCLAFAVTSWDTYYRKFQQSTIQFSLGSHTPSSSNTSTRPSSSETRLPVPPTVIDFPPLLVPAISMEVSSARYLGVYEDSSDHVDQFRPSVDGGFDRTIQGSEEQRKRLINEDEEEIMQLIGRLISRKDLLQAMVLLPIYLNKDPSAAMLTWHETLSWTSSFRELHAISKLGLVNAAHKSGLKMTQSDVNAKDERGLTALHIAAQIGIQEDICVLLEAGAMPHTPDYSSRTPMDYAADGHHDAAMAYLFESFCEIWSSANSSLLNIRNIAERYGLYLKAGRETDTSYLSIALLYATKRSKVEVVRCLLNSGADPNCWDENGTPVLHHALSLTSEKVSVENSFLIIDLLLMNGGDPSIISNNDIAEPALHVAARSGNSLAVFTMIRVGADTRSYDAEGRTALMVLIQATEDQEYAEAMTLRLSLAGVDIERADKKGRRALHIAAQKDFPSVASELVWGCRAEVAPRDNEGRTPLDYARENGSTETVELLERIR
ncbi:ankyrin repeat-containing domain protein [Nemania abortiva]|nr:ankyrin repeat-containing domain protein [Nemania abortiva]